MICADCTMPIAMGTRSFGADTLASAMTIGVKPAKRPCTKRAAKNCSTEVTMPMSAMMITNPPSERMIISLRPKRSASRPNHGPSRPDTAGVTAAHSPAHMATRRGSSTPSWWM